MLTVHVSVIDQKKIDGRETGLVIDSKKRCIKRVLFKNLVKPLPLSSVIEYSLGGNGG